MKILLAEDDVSIQAIAVMALQRIGGHTVSTFDDGIALLDELTSEKLATSKPDLILLDVMMPRLDGFETCKRLKANEATKNIPVIFLTAKAQMHEMHQGMSVGALGYILKPFDPMTLHKQIDEVLSNHAAAA